MGNGRLRCNVCALCICVHLCAKGFGVELDRLVVLAKVFLTRGWAFGPFARSRQTLKCDVLCNFKEFDVTDDGIHAGTRYTPVDKITHAHHARHCNHTNTQRAPCTAMQPHEHARYRTQRPACAVIQHNPVKPPLAVLAAAQFCASAGLQVPQLFSCALVSFAENALFSFDACALFSFDAPCVYLPESWVSTTNHYR